VEIEAANNSAATASLGVQNRTEVKNVKAKIQSLLSRNRTSMNDEKKRAPNFTTAII